MYQLTEDQIEFIRNNEENFRDNNWKAVIRDYLDHTDELTSDGMIIRDYLDHTDELTSDGMIEGIGNFFLETFGENFLEEIGDEIPNDFFAKGRLISITIPHNIKEIGDWAFDRCTALKSISIPSSVKKIGHYVFNNCTSLQSITISKSVEEIDDYVFYNCRSLRSIYVYHNSYAEKWCKESSKGIFRNKLLYLD